MLLAYCLQICVLFGGASFAADPLDVEPHMVHLRSGETREWTSFPEAGPRFWEKKVGGLRTDRAYTLRIRQQNVKQAWGILLNGKPLGELILDERDHRREILLDAGKLKDGDTLRIEPKGKHSLSDDIRIGQIELRERDPKVEPWIAVDTEVVDEATGRPIPCCLTILDVANSLIPLGNNSNATLAVRTGTVYTATGKVKLLVPPEPVTIYATRGFEYSVDSRHVSAGARQGPHILRLALKREVPVPGYVACDTHIHTLTHSGHGDATIDERMITLAGEGIELPIATDHNIHIDFEPHAARLGVLPYFTPVMGNEFTTKAGHFNLFPIGPGARVADAKLTDWKAIFAEAYGTTGAKVCILNHARDLHSGVRPFGPKLFNDVVAEQLEGWPLRFNAMEVINSGATQSDPLELARDWMALLNRGYDVTPVGSSDSHDVARFIVGQGRTYIRCRDDDPAKIDVPAAVDSFLKGQVLVSYGLLTELKMNGQFTSGDLATRLGDVIEVEITVSAPSWIEADRVQLHVNGGVVREAAIPKPEGEAKGGVKWRETWKLPRPKHDVHLVASASGPGIEAPYWATARPYQPMSPELKMRTLGISGAVWIDGDSDGKKSAARHYAERIWKQGVPLEKVLEACEAKDAAIASHVAHLYHAAGGSYEADKLQNGLSRAAPHVREGFHAYFSAWRKTQEARAAK